MAKKKTEETAEATPVDAKKAEETAEATPVEAKKAVKPKKAAKKETSIVEEVLEAAAEVVEDVVETVTKGAADVIKAVAGGPEEDIRTVGKRKEKIGVVWSDKMTKTVVVRVDRRVKHPIYRKYVKRKKKFMAHDDMGATIGDKVRIVETRPLSARKRWRVVEIIQKAEK